MHKLASTGRSPARPPLAYSMADAATLMGVSRQHLYNLSYADKLSTVKIGGRRLVRLTEIERLLEEGA